MLQAECSRCHRVHWSDEAHDGKYLKCAGCGDAVRIGEQKSAYLEPFRPPHEVPFESESKFGRRRFFSNIPFLKLLPKFLVVLCLFAAYLGVNGLNRSRKSDLPAHSKPPVELQPGEYEDASPPPPQLRLEPDTNSVRSSPSYDHHSNRKADIFSYAYFANGQEVIRGSKKRGLGRLTLVNGTQKDAVALIFRENTDIVARSVYVLAGQSANIDKVATGKYFVRVTLGQKWSSDDRSFAEKDEYFTFPHAYAFSEENVGEKTEFDQVSLTLHAVPGGNTKKESISKAQFLAIQPAN